MRAKSTITRQCDYCGTTYSRVRYKAGKYCSVGCASRGSSTARTKPLAERLRERTDTTNTCWLYTGQVSKKTGYGYISAGGYCGPPILAHRAAWELTGPPIPEGYFVLHTCDVRNCVRNDDEGFYEVNGRLLIRRGHLYLGTAKDNSEDMVAKGRSTLGDRNGLRLHPESVLRGDAHHARLHPERLARGESNGNAKMTEAKVRELRFLRNVEHWPLAALSDRFGISVSVAHAIASEKIWRHVT